MAESHFLEGKKIIIAGAGFAGLSFAIALDRFWPPNLERPHVVIYNRHGRCLPLHRQGRSILLSGSDQNGGLVAARDLGLLDDLMEQSVIRNDSSSAFRLWSSDWTTLMSNKLSPYQDLPTSGIRIDRNRLRETMVGAAERLYTITWDTTCTSAEQLPGGRMRVHTSSTCGGGTTSTDDCDLLVAADGANSKLLAYIRPQDKLEPTGTVVLGGLSRFPDGVPEPATKNWGLVMSGQGVTGFFSPLETTCIAWSLSFLGPPREQRYDASSDEQFAALKKEVLQRGLTLQEPFQTIVHATVQASSFTLSPIDKKPFRHTGDDAIQGLVFVGDANHAVSPYAGNGANMALMDGLDLARQLCVSESLDQAVAAYDELAISRAEDTLKKSHQKIAFLHATGLYYYALRGALCFGSFGRIIARATGMI